MINYLKDCSGNTPIGMLPDIINSNNEAIKSEFNWVFDSSLNRLTKSVYVPTGSVKAHFGEFTNLAAEYVTIKNVDSLKSSIKTVVDELIKEDDENLRNDVSALDASVKDLYEHGGEGGKTYAGGNNILIDSSAIITAKGYNIEEVNNIVIPYVNQDGSEMESNTATASWSNIIIGSLNYVVNSGYAFVSGLGHYVDGENFTPGVTVTGRYSDLHSFSELHITPLFVVGNGSGLTTRGNAFSVNELGEVKAQMGIYLYENLPVASFSTEATFKSGEVLTYNGNIGTSGLNVNNTLLSSMSTPIISYKVVGKDASNNTYDLYVNVSYGGAILLKKGDYVYTVATHKTNDGAVQSGSAQHLVDGVWDGTYDCTVSFKKDNPGGYNTITCTVNYKSFDNIDWTLYIDKNGIITVEYLVAYLEEKYEKKIAELENRIAELEA